MAITTYSELQTAVANWLNRQDLTDRIPEFIAFAEATLNRNLRVKEMVERDTATINSGYINMPSDWLETITLFTTGSPPIVLEYVRVHDLNEVRATQRTGDPVFYTLINNKFYVFPEPTSDTTVDMIYYAKIPVLSGSNTTNWLLTSHPDVYLFGTLLQAEPYLKNDERLQVWASMYKGVTDSLVMQSERAWRPEGGLHARRRTFG